MRSPLGRGLQCCKEPTSDWIAFQVAWLACQLCLPAAAGLHSSRVRAQAQRRTSHGGGAARAEATGCQGIGRGHANCRVRGPPCALWSTILSPAPPSSPTSAGLEVHSITPQQRSQRRCFEAQRSSAWGRTGATASPPPTHPHPPPTPAHLASQHGAVPCPSTLVPLRPRAALECAGNSSELSQELAAMTEAAEAASS